jgi:hypothetical protein
MAKGQKRGNRELKKPKTTVKKPAAAAASHYQLPIRTAPAAKTAGK